MPITQAGLQASITWALQNPATPFGPNSQGPLAQLFNLLNLDITTVNQVFAQQIVLAGGANQDVDFFSFTNGVGEATGFLHIQCIFVGVASTSASSVTFGKGGTHPLTWFFGGTAPTITIPPGGVQLFSVPVGGTLATISSTVRTFNLLDGGSGSTTNVLAFGSTT